MILIYDSKYLQPNPCFIVKLKVKHSMNMTAIAVPVQPV